MSDAGNYACQLSPNDLRELEHSVEIRKLLKITKEPSSGRKKALEGDDVTFSCTTNSSTEPVITWSKMNDELTEGNLESENSKLYLKNVTRNYSGTYVCSAQNEFGQKTKENIELDVEYAPEITTGNFQIIEKENNPLELECIVDAEPEAEITWFKNTFEISENDLIFKQYGDKHTISIQSLSSNDYGNYSCRAQNSRGEARKHLKVISGKASLANFKSNPFGQMTNSFLIEWNSVSVLEIEKFELQWREEGENWQTIEEIIPINNNGNYDGKYEFTGISDGSKFEV